MSGIDLSNAQVLKNYVTSQILEGKGQIYIKEKVKVFRTDSGMEYVMPEDLTIAAKAEPTPAVVESKSIADEFSEYTDEQLVEAAKTKGIKSAHLFGREKLIQKLISLS
jgi:hypothetical protein